MLKSEELKQELEVMKVSAKELTVASEITAKIEEIKALKAKIELAEIEEAEAREEVENKIKNMKKDKVKDMHTDNIKQTANVLRLMIKDMAKKPLTEEEVQALAPFKNVKNSVTGESYILPQDLSSIITKKIRAFNSLKEQFGYIKTSAMTGAFPVDATEDVELIDFVDGTPASDSGNLKFTQVTFSMKEKGAIIGLTNTLLAFTDSDLIDFVADKMARRYVKTVNKMGFDLLKADKEVKTLADVKALVKSLQVDIDPAQLSGSVVITNQNGYQKLIEKENLNGVSYVQPDLTKAPILIINEAPVVVFANSMLADRTVSPTEKYAPVVYGNITNAVKFVDSGIYNFATSTEAGFTSNMTLTRLITYFDIVKADGADEVYQYGEIKL